MKMVPNRKWLSLVMCATLLLAAFVGCAPSGQTPAQSENPSTTDSAAAPAESAPPAADGEEVLLTILDWQNEQNMYNGVVELTEKFMETHPNVKFSIEIKDDTQIVETYKMRLYADDAPDIMQGKPRNMVEFIEGGFVMDLSDQPFLERVDEKVRPELEVNGKYWGVPLDIQAKGVLYNKRMFAEAGLEVPTTSDEFFAVCDAFAAQGINPLFQPLEAYSNSYHVVDIMLKPMAFLRGETSIFADSQAGTAKLADSAVAKDVFTIYDRILTYKEANDPGLGVQDAQHSFAVGNRPMFINGMWCVIDVMTVAEEAGSTDEFGVFPLPWSNNPAENLLWLGLDDVYLLSTQSDHQDLLLEWADMLVSPDGAEIWMRNCRLLPSYKGLEVTDPLPHIADILSYVEKGQALGNAEVPDYSSEPQVAFKQEIQAFGIQGDGERNVDAFLAGLDDVIADAAA